MSLFFIIALESPKKRLFIWKETLFYIILFLLPALPPSSRSHSRILNESINSSFCAEQILPPLHLSKSLFEIWNENLQNVASSLHFVVRFRSGWVIISESGRQNMGNKKYKKRAHKFMHEFHDEQCAHTRWRPTTWMRADWNERQRRRHVREHECIFMSLNFNYWHGGHLKFHFVFFFALYAAVGLLLPPVWARREREQQQRRRRGRAARKT